MNADEYWSLTKVFCFMMSGPLLTGLSSILQNEKKVQDSACVSDGVVYDG